MGKDNVVHLPVPVAKTVTVDLIQESVDAIRQIQELTGDKEVDIVNRALQVYARIEKELAKENKIYVVDTKGGMSRIKFGGK